MKLQVALLAVGLFVSVGAVGAELNRAANVSSISVASSNTVSVAKSSLSQGTASTSTATLGAKPSIAGGLGDD